MSPENLQKTHQPQEEGTGSETCQVISRFYDSVSVCLVRIEQDRVCHKVQT